MMLVGEFNDSKKISEVKNVPVNMATQTVSTTRALDERHDGPCEACDSESMFEDIDFQHELNERCRIKGMFFFSIRFRSHPDIARLHIQG